MRMIRGSGDKEPQAHLRVGLGGSSLSCLLVDGVSHIKENVATNSSRVSASSISLTLLEGVFTGI